MDIPRTYRIIVGLGNPGPAYRNTYHNAGALFVEFLAKEWSLARESRGSMDYYRGEGIVLFTPPSFMNQTGASVRRILKHFRIPPEEMLVVHDDFDLPVGKTRMSFARGSAGHLGVESIIAVLKTNRFSRLRIGVRSRPGKAGMLVLKRISPDDKRALLRVFHSLATTNSI